MGMDMVKAHFSASVFIAIDPIVIETPEGSLIQNLTIEDWAKSLVTAILLLRRFPILLRVRSRL